MSTATNVRQIENLLLRFSFYEAAELARSGNFVAAEAILQELLLSANPPTPVLDLQARICAQQGCLHDASEFWRRALQKEPANAAYQAALARLNRMQRQPIWLQMVWPLLLSLGIVTCGAIAFFSLLSNQSSDNTRLRQQLGTVQSEGSATQQQIRNLLAEMQVLNSNQAAIVKAQSGTGPALVNLDNINSTLVGFSEQIKALRSQTLRMATEQEIFDLNSSNQIAALRLTSDREHSQAMEAEDHRSANGKSETEYATLLATYEKVMAQLSLPTNAPTLTNIPKGITASIEGESVLLTFDEGLFDHGTHFKLGAKSRLEVLAKRLSQASEPLQITVVGYADDDRTFLQWTAKWESSLALERAAAVVDYFIELGVFRPANASAVSGDGRNRPFPSDSLQNRARNKTVVVRVERAAIAR
jgi:flagellar motor protein MotB